MVIYTNSSPIFDFLIYSFAINFSITYYFHNNLFDIFISFKWSPYKRKPGFKGTFFAVLSIDVDEYHNKPSKRGGMISYNNVVWASYAHLRLKDDEA